MLSVYAYRLTFTANNSLRLAKPSASFQPYMGSAWRGAFGMALKDIDFKAYDVIFETKRGAHNPQVIHGSHAPHPIVISPQTQLEHTVQVNQNVQIYLSLFGIGHQYKQQCLQAMQIAGMKGVHGTQYLMVQVE